MITTMRRVPSPSVLVVVFLGLAGLAAEAHAYLDPSTGSMILSAIVGLFATLGLAVKTYWYRLKNLLTGRSKPAGRREAHQPSSQPAVPGRDGLTSQPGASQADRAS